MSEDLSLFLDTFFSVRERKKLTRRRSPCLENWKEEKEETLLSSSPPPTIHSRILQSSFQLVYHLFVPVFRRERMLIKSHLRNKFSGLGFFSFSAISSVFSYFHLFSLSCFWLFFGFSAVFRLFSCFSAVELFFQLFHCFQLFSAIFSWIYLHFYP